MTENIVQAVARDCLAEVLKRIENLGLQVVFHVHDEVIIDAPVDVTVEQICSLMAEPVPWAEGLVLKGAGFENGYYMKGYPEAGIRTRMRSCCLQYPQAYGICAAAPSDHSAEPDGHAG